jgi:hypothetical protein
LLFGYLVPSCLEVTLIMVKINWIIEGHKTSCLGVHLDYHKKNVTRNEGLGLLAKYVFMSYISVRLSIFVALKQFRTFCLLSFNGAFVWWLLLHGDIFRGYVYLWWCVRNLGCTWLLYCLLVDFMWSGTIVDGMFVLHLDLGDVVCCVQTTFLKAYGGWRWDFRTQINEVRHILFLCFRFPFCVFIDENSVHNKL